MSGDIRVKDTSGRNLAASLWRANVSVISKALRHESDTFAWPPLVDRQVAPFPRREVVLTGCDWPELVSPVVPSAFARLVVMMLLYLLLTADAVFDTIDGSPARLTEDFARVFFPVLPLGGATVSLAMTVYLVSLLDFAVLLTSPLLCAFDM